MARIKKTASKEQCENALREAKLVREHIWGMLKEDVFLAKTADKWCNLYNELAVVFMQLEDAASAQAFKEKFSPQGEGSP